MNSDMLTKLNDLDMEAAGAEEAVDDGLNGKGDMDDNDDNASIGTSKSKAKKEVEKGSS